MSEGYALDMHLIFTVDSADEAAGIRLATVTHLLENTPLTIIRISKFGPTAAPVAVVPDETAELDTEVAV